jgi:DNA-binding transcriptional regulator YhcF (GntR family)
VQCFLVLAAETAAADALGTIEQRLARWLLMAQDRVGGPELPLTHEYLSFMLGVRRAGVTEALQAIQMRGLISKERGLVRVVDRDGIIELANGLYGLPEREYERLIRASKPLALKYESYLNKAEELRIIAEDYKAPETRDSLLRLAADYENMASRLSSGTSH